MGGELTQREMVSRGPSRPQTALTEGWGLLEVGSSHDWLCQRPAGGPAGGFQEPWAASSSQLAKSQGRQPHGHCGTTSGMKTADPSPAQPPDENAPSHSGVAACSALSREPSRARPGLLTQGLGAVLKSLSLWDSAAEQQKINMFFLLVASL